MTQGAKKLAFPAFTGFKQHGRSGAWVSDFLPHTASIADELCFVKSMHTNAVNHAPAITFFLTGAEQPGRPSMGAWLTYGLGSETQDLPGFVVMTSRDKEASCGQIFYDFYWGSGFLPSKYQGVKFRGSGDPVLYLSNPDGMSREVRRGLLDDLAQLNELKLRRVRRPGDRHAHRPVRDGLPHAGERAGADRLLERAAGTCSTCTARTCRGRARSPTTA